MERERQSDNYCVCLLATSVCYCSLDRSRKTTSSGKSCIGNPRKAFCCGMSGRVPLSMPQMCHSERRIEASIGSVDGREQLRLGSASFASARSPRSCSPSTLQTYALCSTTWTGTLPGYCRLSSCNASGSLACVDESGVVSAAGSTLVDTGPALAPAAELSAAAPEPEEDAGGCDIPSGGVTGRACVAQGPKGVPKMVDVALDWQQLVRLGAGLWFPPE